MTGTVVLLHGLASSSALTWSSTGLIELIRDLGRDVAPIDLLGHGTAPQPTDPTAYADLAGWVLDRLPQDTPVDVVAFSLGARLALEIAARTEGRISSIVAAGVGANLLVDQDLAAVQSAALADVLAPPFERSEENRHDDPLAAHFERLCVASGSDPHAVAALLRRPPGKSWPPEWSSIDLPITVVVGEHDFAGPAEPLVALLPNATAVTVRGADHFSLPKSMGFFDAVLDHLGM